MAHETPAPAPALTRDELVRLLRRQRYGVVASLGPSGEPQAATVGYGVSDALELVFDTLGHTRKCQNLRRDGRVAFVVTEGEETIQCEGVADEPRDAELDRLLPVYLAAFPDGLARQSWPGLTYVRIAVAWARYSDFRGPEPRIVEARF
ncbi:MAG: pyridoxamine 5'-phosphate oxidase family protein [Myxococcota bacterium]